MNESLNTTQITNPLILTDRKITANTGYDIENWDVENRVFWEMAGKKIALRNLVFSIFAEFLAFSIWQVWSVVAVQLPIIGFHFTMNQLFWLAAVPGITGATLRLPYAFMVPILGGRNWTLISTGLLLIPAMGIAYAVQHPETPYVVFFLLALLCGFGGGNFASSMSNINFFFPRRRKGFALGLNAAGGNIGVSIVQFVAPIVITMSIFGSLGGSPRNALVNGKESSVFLQNAALIWIPFIILSLITTWFFMNNLRISRTSFTEQFRMFSDRHTWLMSILYMGTFGSFIGYSAGFPLLIKSQFPDINPLHFTFVGPLLGSLVRPFGGWIADRVGGARVTFWNFIVMLLAVLGALYFLGVEKRANAFPGFFTMMIVLFFTAGIGNGSTYRMIPHIFMKKNGVHDAESSSMDAVNRANKQTGAVVGITSAFAAYGAFFIPKSFGSSIELTGSPIGALMLFAAFYVLCICITFYFYKRKNARTRC